MAVETQNAASIGSYDLIAKIAEGGMGAVHKARHKDTGEIVAIKIMPEHLAKNPVFLKRFAQEYRAARTIDHPNIVQALEFGEEADAPYLVMEFVDGESLGRRLEREKRLDIDEALRVIGAVAGALGHAHSLGLIHRDVKPDNILLTKPKPGFPQGDVKLTDLGLIKDLDADQNLTRAGRGLGTPNFMAPEQFRNAKNAGIRCDIYSLAATLYMMVTGELPFQAQGPLEVLMKKVKGDLPSPRQLVPALPEQIDRAIRRAMSLEPQDRPATCAEFIQQLTAARPPQECATLEDTQGAASESEPTPLVMPVLPEVRRPGPRLEAEARAALPAAPVDKSPPAAADETRAPSAVSSVPHIELLVNAGTSDWMKWTILLFIAAGSAVAGYCLMN